MRRRLRVSAWACALGLLTSASSWAQSELVAAGPVMLPPVFVTATRFAADANTLPFGVQVISADDIRRAGVTTVNEALMKLLGVPGRQDFYGAGDYALDLRGYGATAASNQVIVLDGVRLNEADLSTARLAGIPIDTVERIEVVRGSGSVLYGEGSGGGVIVITTRAGSSAARSNSAQITAGIGSFGVRDLRGSGTIVAGDFSIDASASRRLADNDRDNFRSAATGTAVSGQWQRDGLRFGLGHAEDALNTGLPGALTTQQYADDPHQTTHPNDNARITNRRNTLFGQATVGDWQLAVDAGWRTKALRSFSFGSVDDYDVTASTQSVRAKNMARIDGVDNTLVLGFDRGQWQRGVTAFSAPATQRSHAWYARDEATLGGGTRISAGLRNEAMHEDKSGAPPTVVDASQRAWELGVLQPLGGGTSVYARIGRSYRLPNVDEFGYIAGAPLRVQTSRDGELGARWAADGSRVEMRLYRSDLNDEIGFDPSVVMFGANVNFDPTRRQGFEFELSQELAETFTLHANAALRRATFRAGAHEGKDVPLTPRNTVSLRGEWQPTQEQQIDLIVNRVGSQKPDFDNACRMPAYATADLRYAYRWTQAEISLGITNLTGRKYYTQAFGCTAGEVDSIYPEAGRAFSTALRLSF